MCGFTAYGFDQVWLKKTIIPTQALHNSVDAEKLFVRPALLSVVFKLCDLLSVPLP
jgi:hypothetical protein